MGPASWSETHLDSAARSHDFRVSPFRDDGITPGTPVWVWAVVVADAAYVRSSNPSSRWFAAAVAQGGGRASFPGWEGEVVFAVVDDRLVLDAVDRSFREKYRDDPYLTEDLLLASRGRVLSVRPASA